MKMCRKLIALLCVAALAASLSVCVSAADTEESEAEQHPLLGRVVSIDEDGTVTVELGRTDRAGKPNPDGSELPELSNGELPELPEGDLPELPDGEQPELPDGEQPEKSRTITLSAEEVEGLDLEVGTLVSVSLAIDEDGNESATVTVADETELPDDVQRPDDAEHPEKPEDGNLPDDADAERPEKPEDGNLPEGVELPDDTELPEEAPAVPENISGNPANGIGVSREVPVGGAMQQPAAANNISSVRGGATAGAIR